MSKRSLASAVCAISIAAAQALVPENLVVEGVPPIPDELREKAGRYLDFRFASFQGWHPVERRMLITTRFAETAQLHAVAAPGGARQQLTFLPERILGGTYRPGTGEFIVFSQDKGGGEFYQFYRYDLSSGGITLLTDGQSRNTAACWSRSGKILAFSSTQRNGRDADIHLMNPSEGPGSRIFLELEGGGWAPADFSPNEKMLLIREGVSINESYLWLATLGTGKKELITERTGEKVAYGAALFAKDGKSIFVTSDKDSEFRRLGRIDLATKRFEPLTGDADVESFDLSPDGTTMAYVTNEDGVSNLRIVNTETGEALPGPSLPKGVIGGLEWHKKERLLGFSLAAAQTAGDAYSYDLKSGKLERWTESETSGLNPKQFPEPELIRLKSFDGVPITAFAYHPDKKKFPGRRPALILIHGGPESQSRPGFMARYNYFINEMGIALIVPNVRGSSGYGKTFLLLDNGFKREDSVKDIGAVLDWIGEQGNLDRDRVAVIGGSYGGYMVLASMIHHAERIRAGIDIVGISNFLTFLKNTQDYRRDLRRAEYGDERDEAMRAFLEKISPSNQAAKIKDPLFVIQGKNDPRVPLSESEQMVQAVRENGGAVWYLMARDEGHGFARKSNQDYQFLSTILFLEKFLLGSEE